MKHILRGRMSDRAVWLDGERLYPTASQRVRNHSPDGFNWGYGGSGPAQLALGIVLKLTGFSNGYQDFKWKFIALLPQTDFEKEFEYPIMSQAREGITNEHQTEQSENCELQRCQKL